jgi:hypothetical protein
MALNVNLSRRFVYRQWLANVQKEAQDETLVAPGIQAV